MDGIALMEPVARPITFPDKKFGLKNHNGTVPEGVKKLINKLLVNNNQQHRTAIIVVLVFTVLASLLVICSILRDAYKVKEGEAYSPAQCVLS